VVKNVVKNCIDREQLKDLLAYAREIEDVRLATLCMRTLDGDSLYHNSMIERCTAAHAGAHTSREFKRAAKKRRAEES